MSQRRGGAADRHDPRCWSGSGDIDPSTGFGEATAEAYDDQPAGTSRTRPRCWPSSPAPAPALELAIGTGRIAQPLAVQGVRVEGIELSSAMLAQLRVKPGGPDLHVTVGDMATTIRGALSTGVRGVQLAVQPAQPGRGHVAASPTPRRTWTAAGVFKVEAFVSSFLQRPAITSRSTRSASSSTTPQLDVAHHEPVIQRLEASHVHPSAR